jgi:hypothetical protein
MKKEKTELPPYHELFELPEGTTPQEFPPPPNFQSIKVWVTRFGGPNGIEKCPRPWLLAEIPSMVDFHNMFGGGRYSIEGRTLGGQFYARREFVLAGASKPLILSDASQPEAKPAPGTLPAVGANLGDALAMAGRDPQSLLIMIMMQNAERAEARADRQAMQSVEMFKAMAVLMGGQNRGTDPAIANVFGSMTELVKAGMQRTPEQPQAQKPLSVEDEFRRAKDLLELARKMNPEEKPEKIVDIIKELLPLVPPDIIRGLMQPVANGAPAAGGIVVEQVAGGSVG